jgi:hypothetical protein
MHAIGSLFRLVRAAEVAQAGTQAALHVDRELLGCEADPRAAFHEQPVVVVDLLVGQQVNVVLRRVLGGPAAKIVILEVRYGPAPDHAFRDDERCARVDRCRAAVGAPER